jgi:hypothetical protein
MRSHSGADGGDLLETPWVIIPLLRLQIASVFLVVAGTADDVEVFKQLLA